MSNLVFVVFNDTFNVRPLPVKEALFRNNAKPRIASKLRRNEELLNLAQDQGSARLDRRMTRSFPKRFTTPIWSLSAGGRCPATQSSAKRQERPRHCCGDQENSFLTWRKAQMLR